MCDEPQFSIVGALGGIASTATAAIGGAVSVVGMLVGVLTNPVALTVVAGAGSGAVVYTLAGGSVVASFAILVATGALAISGIVALAKAASTVRKVPAAAPVRPALSAPRRRPMRVVASQTATLALEEARPSFDYVVTQEQRVTAP